MKSASKDFIVTVLKCKMMTKRDGESGRETSSFDPESSQPRKQRLIEQVLNQPTG